MTTKLFFTAIVMAVTLASCSSKEERNKRAQEKAQAQVEEEASRLKGVGEALKGAGKDAVETVTEGVGSVIKGASEGIDKGLISLEMRPAKETTQYFETNRTELNTNSLENKEIISYLTFNKACKGKLILKVFNKDNKEIARSVISIDKQEDEAGYVEFPFDQRTAFSLIKYCTLEYKP